MIPDHITGKAITAASLALSDWLDEQELTDRFPAHLIGCTPSMVSQVAISAALTSVYADIQAEALREAARVIDCRYASLMPGCDVDALDYDTPTDYGTDLAAWWLTDRAAKLDGSTK